MKRIGIGRLLSALAMAAAAPQWASAQAAKPPQGRRELVGFIRDPAGKGVDGAAVEIAGTSVRTDTAGAFRLFTRNVDTVTISIRRLGFSPIEALLQARGGQWDTLVVEMEGSSQRLPNVKVQEDRNRRAYEGLRTFDERKAQGHGVFITRTDITDRNSLRLSDVLQTRRSINLVKVGTNRMGVRFVAYTGSRGTTCIPDMWLDGQRARGMEIDDLVATTVEAMELYDSFSTVPSQFAHSANSVPCGTIVVWTRIPGKP